MCVGEKDSPGSPEPAIEEDPSKYQSYTLGDYLVPPSVLSFPTSGHSSPREPLSKKKESQLMEEWVNSPDLLVCIHPNNGSLMVWTVEGLDAPKHSTRYVHIVTLQRLSQGCNTVVKCGYNVTGWIK